MQSEHDSLAARLAPAATQRDLNAAIGPLHLGEALVDALGLSGVKGILRMQIDCEGGRVPTVTIVRTITHEQAGASCALLKEWRCDLVPQGPAVERELRADGSVGEARTPASPSSHPREG